MANMAIIESVLLLQSFNMIDMLGYACKERLTNS